MTTTSELDVNWAMTGIIVMAVAAVGADLLDLAARVRANLEAEAPS